MFNETKKLVKKHLQDLLKVKSITIYGDGRIEIIQRFKPSELGRSDRQNINNNANLMLAKIQDFLDIKYRVQKIEISPNITYEFCLKSFEKDSLSSYRKYIKYYEVKNGKAVKAFIHSLTTVYTPNEKLDKTKFNEILCKILLNHN